MGRHEDLERLYRLFDRLAETLGGPYRLKDCDGRMDWPDRGVYFFFAAGETRESSEQPRLTRVGTHAISAGSTTTLWDRLKQHYGTGSRSDDHPHGGNQRGSVFRREVGRALVERHDLHDQYPAWDRRRIGSDSRERSTVRDEEYPLERRVSTYIRDLPFLWVAVDDEPGSESERASIERNAIALASNRRGQPLDPRGDWWLGNHSPAREIRESGLWNVRDVDAEYDAGFLDRLAARIAETDSL